MRRCLSDVLKAKNFDYKVEYQRLYSLFYKTIVKEGRYCDEISLYEHCSKYFLRFPLFLRSTCVSLKDFNDEFNYKYIYWYAIDTIDELISFCEYSYNLTMYLGNSCTVYSSDIGSEYGSFYIDQILYVIEKFGYMQNKKDGITDFVPKNPAAIAVAEIIDEDLAYDVIEYNHHSMRGDLLAKKTTLLRFANLLEPKRSDLKAVNEKLSVNIFFMFNNLDLRHNNSTDGDKNYQQYTEQMTKEDLEAWYDELYQMCLLAFLEIDNIERAEKVDVLKKNYKS